MFNFQVIGEMKAKGINTIGPKLKFMRYVAYIRSSEKEISDAIATGDSDYAWSEITRIERERHEYHDQAIEAVKALNQMAEENGFEKPYDKASYQRDYITDFCIEYLTREAK